MEKSSEVKEGIFFGVISYIGFFCIVTLILKKDNKFALYHAKQGLVLFVFEVVCFVLSIIPILAWLMKTAGFIVFIAASLAGMYRAAKGKHIRIPVVSDIAEKIVL